MTIFNPTERFSSREANYVRYRPGYPPEILDPLRRECGLTADWVIADVGCGTGLLAKVFLESGNRLFGIEPNKEMREAGESFLCSYSKFMSLPGTAEDTGLPDRSVDLVTAGQAAHWFDRERARPEFLRILRRTGWTVLLWNERASRSSAFMQGYEDLVETYGTDYDEVRRVDPDRAVTSFFAPNRVCLKTFLNRQEFDLAGLEGRLLSSSYFPEEGDPKYEPMLCALRHLFETHQENGVVRFNYETHMYYGQLG
jgi:SAM-dependent methyltransferase